MNFCIAIDGPAGAGKSTIAKLLAKKLGFVYVDTGAMYRAMGLYFYDNKLDTATEKDVQYACEHADITISYNSKGQIVLLNGCDVTDKIRTENAGLMASKVAVLKDIRIKLVELQRKLASKENVIMDGRDVGTYILPDANLKIYLTASAEERASRRYQELVQKGVECDLEQIKEDIIARDEQDMNREFAPLKQAEDAVLIDSSHLTIEEVVEEMSKLYEARK